MSTTHCSCARQGFTLIELLCVIAIIGILVALLLPGLTQAKARAKRLQCVSHLHQAGVAFQSFAQDHNGQFPMAVPGNAGGSLDFTRSAYQTSGLFYFSFHHFQVLSNELVTPRLVLCPADTRMPASGFNTLQNANLSYVVGLNADPSRPNSVLAADRNLTNDWTGPSSLIRFGGNYTLRWTAGLHEYKGNVLFADGHVEEVSNPGLVEKRNQLPMTADLVLPSTLDLGRVASGSVPGSPVISPPAVVSPGRASAGSATPDRNGAVSRDASNLGTSSQLATARQDSVPSASVPFTNIARNPGTAATNQIPSPAPDKTAEDDPGFLLFPPSFTAAVITAAKVLTWLALLLLALLVAIKILQNRSAPPKRRRRESLDED